MSIDLSELGAPEHRHDWVLIHRTTHWTPGEPPGIRASELSTSELHAVIDTLTARGYSDNWIAQHLHAHVRTIRQKGHTA